MAETSPTFGVADAFRFSVAPMMEWTDRHCRSFHRLLTRRALLYTEMIPAAAVVRGENGRRFLAHDDGEHPLALQLGGSDPAELSAAARIAAEMGFYEINLNVGCPSDRVKSGAFGACLMRDPQRVAQCCAAMAEGAAAGAPAGATPPEITVKCRLGVDEQVPEEALPAFLDVVAEAGVRRFTVHARKAWLQGLSPKDNREIPPLDYPLVGAMKARRPDLTVCLNGGLSEWDAIEAALAPSAADGLGLDGAMIGRAAYYEPHRILATADQRFFGASARPLAAADAARAMEPYIARRLAEGVGLHAMTRHMLGLFAGRPGARAWRRLLSTEATQPGADFGLVERALAAQAAAEERRLERSDDAAASVAAAEPA